MLLLKLFVKDYQNTESTTVREKYGIISGVSGILLNIILSVLKFIVGAITNSVAITADAFNNLTDCLTSLLTILGFRWSAKPADREHPFGHARIEYLISLAVAGIILVTGYEVVRSSITAIIDPETLYFSIWAVVVMVFSMVVKLWMMVFNKKLGKAINSNTLMAVGVDSRNDVLINAVALFSLIFALITGISIDGYVGVLLGLVFLRAGYNVAKESLGRIIGNPSDGSIANKIKEIIKGHEGVLGVHDLVVHSYGPGRDMASVYVEVPMDLPLKDSYSIVKEIRCSVDKQLRIPIVIQLTPIDLGDERLRNIVGITQDFIAKEHPSLHPNEFRIIDEVPKPIIVFDLEFPLVIKKDNALVLRDLIAKEVRLLLPGYDCDINIEYGYAE
ncbi:MAG: cation diffusion facilitator family transporter [Defluviitaleaceae bacterium]|nr:cation diffusion facilitator family transporter [Defluviitaleaceae bacterium]